MCLSIPSEVVEIHPEDNTLTVMTMGVQRRISRHLILDELKAGDYVLVHAGFAMGTIDVESARASLELYQDIIASIEAEEANQVTA
ncbi:HypC/HybG/HupF family hydrogenase formation chaperone [Sansalvadorimonas verongulae]|uniref:HypC/HybG/HupF family hydrogenase formation chaperone n=1 Tax=Sansalvadorimonas verongulae TaxID=2172824 RepID=UPI0012BCF55E|nr:HypC/HybG/HupF family hydrogenase formation chaperone [Sansalvadorimonas verongulae]MTI14554.1 HypC/HybG/HupF family hydrogenase formation chaperone [Sansalvadorimonas verongulae]